MELSQEVAQAVWRSDFVYSHRRLRTKAAQAKPVDWIESGLNPRNRVDTLLPLDHLRRRVDGGMFGTHLFVIPLDVPQVPPLRISISIPDVGEIPRPLRDSLDSASAVPLQKHDASMTGVAKHVCHALDYHCKQNPGFLEHYFRMPFGSRIVFENIASHVKDMRVVPVPNYDLERKAMSLNQLKAVLGETVSAEQWPPAIDIMDLSLEKHLHDTVALVRCPTSALDTQGRSVIFKHISHSVADLLHELKYLLNMTPHQNVVPRPLAIITKKSNFGGKLAVLGFLIPYYEQGSMRDLLPHRRLAGTLRSSQQLTWCKQVAAALDHIHKVHGTFYSDLRPDNVLVSVSHDHGTETAILCDFEQRGNWYEWCPPEVLYVQYAENLRKARYSPEEELTWETRIQTFLQDKDQSHTRNRAWNSMSHETQEKAMVYCLGLFMYCVFEGQSNVCGNKVNHFTYEPDIEFPTFRRTPPRVKGIIERCTDRGVYQTPMRKHDGADKDIVRPFVRVGGLLYPDGALHCQTATPSTACRVLDGVLKYWEQELAHAKDFLKCGHELAKTNGLNRPTLSQVLDELNAAENEFD
ncbi:hypothetical protein PG985_005359 [Apiospora marii]|uniref:uncharacterized protein n=1 Tax=Apiospora marii TaxID=335849 RepID=UPI00312EF822